MSRILPKRLRAGRPIFTGVGDHGDTGVPEKGNRLRVATEAQDAVQRGAEDAIVIIDDAAVAEIREHLRLGIVLHIEALP